jgi:TolB-like protein/DNA-binding winged helix-turn-helix (wHTH) protein
MAGAPSNEPHGYRIGDVTIDMLRRRVHRGKQEIELGELSYKLLVALARSAPAVLSHDELLEQVWQGRFVSPPTLKQRITLLRKALGDDATDPRYIRVVRGHGCTLIPSVEPFHDKKNAFAFRPAWAAAAPLIALIAAAIVYMALPSSHYEPQTLAVLPFENLSPDPDDAYFATGLHEELLDRLGEVDGIRLASRVAVRRFADSATAVRDLADELDVDAVMEGTVNYRNGQIRISARLVDPDTGIQSWSDTYERDSNNILAVQGDIARSVAGALGVKLGIQSPNAFRGAGTNNIEAYEAFLEGLHVLGGAMGQDRAIAFFRKATELDPDYSAAWAHMGFATAAKSFYAAPGRSRSVLDEAMPHLLRAVELDPTSARAAAMLGFVRYHRLDWIGGEREYARAIELHASQLTLVQHAGLLARAGRVMDARSEFYAAESSEPTFGMPAPVKIQTSIAQANYAEARTLASLDSLPIRRQRLILSIAVNEGDLEAIKDALQEVMAIESATRQFFSQLMHKLESRDEALAFIRAAYYDQSRQWPSKQSDIGLFAAYLGDPELAVQALAGALTLSTIPVAMLWYPMMAEVRQLPAFKDLVTDLNLVAYWRAYGWADACIPVGEFDFRCS